MLDTFIDYIIGPIFNNYSVKIYWLFSKIYFVLIFLVFFTAFILLIFKVFKKAIFRIIFLLILLAGLVVMIAIPFKRGIYLNGIRQAGYETVDLIEEYKNQNGSYPDSLNYLNRINEEKFTEIRSTLSKIDYVRSNYGDYYLTIHDDVLYSQWWFYDFNCKCFKTTGS